MAFQHHLAGFTGSLKTGLQTEIELSLSVDVLEKIWIGIYAYL
jgi:hypothetical protein